MICALVLTPDPAALGVLELLKPDYVFLAYRGRALAEAARRLGDVRICTYLPGEVPPGFKAAGPLSFLEACRGKPAIVL
ncbi:hypothetical protein TUZN_1094 [Thermoproteus uzoniensis 768-20]|uniref:Uncharacterized protein n=1 Tax=Thermoproteus uzoniensis (strain 768-20) TaxID=999630 RepID=F2L092_THEU7|nr:hypothetical protein [Thermoproteus uzoniensis]AEA12574.1 hypothetical protein TUZN_1094 [Thermoproteus uzoniensis 768-20]